MTEAPFRLRGIGEGQPVCGGWQLLQPSRLQLEHDAGAFADHHATHRNPEFRSSSPPFDTKKSDSVHTVHESAAIVGFDLA